MPSRWCGVTWSDWGCSRPNQLSQNPMCVLSLAAEQVRPIPTPPLLLTGTGRRQPLQKEYPLSCSRLLRPDGIETIVWLVWRASRHHMPADLRSIIITYYLKRFCQLQLSPSSCTIFALILTIAVASVHAFNGGGCVFQECGIEPDRMVVLWRCGLVGLVSSAAHLPSLHGGRPLAIGLATPQ